WGMNRCLAKLGGLPETLVWDREGAIHAGGGRPTQEFAAFCGRLAVGWRILEAKDPESKGALERTHRFLRSNFEPARCFANHLDFQPARPLVLRARQCALSPRHPRGPHRVPRRGAPEHA